MASHRNTVRVGDGGKEWVSAGVDA